MRPALPLDRIDREAILLNRQVIASMFAASGWLDPQAAAELRKERDEAWAMLDDLVAAADCDCDDCRTEKP